MIASPRACLLRTMSAIVAVLFFAVTQCVADCVLLKSGELVSGTIVKDEAEWVHIQVQIGETSEVRVIARKDVHSTYAGLKLPTKAAQTSESPAKRQRFASQESEESDPSRDRGKRDEERVARLKATETTKYLRLDLHGTFGKDFDGWAVQDVIDQAKRNGVRQILISLDSPGGYVYAAEDMAKRIREAPAEIQFTCLIRNAISAAIWVVIECDDVFFESGGATGAAVTYTHSNSSGSAEVDAKYNAATAAMLEAACERTKTWPPPVVRAMVVQTAELWVTRDANGGHASLSASPIDTSSYQVDDKDSVLALSTASALEWGLGKAWDTRSTFTADWKLHSKMGDVAVRKAAKRLADIENGETAAKRLPALMANVTDNPHPSHFNDYRYVTRTYWTGSSWAQSTSMSDVSSRMWRERQARFCESRRELLFVAHEAFDRLKRHDEKHLGERGSAVKKVLAEVGNDIYGDWQGDCR